MCNGLKLSTKKKKHFFNSSCVESDHIS